jgi:hypothetical protein
MGYAWTLAALLVLAGCATPSNYTPGPDPCAGGAEASLDCQAWRYRNTM